MPRRRLSALRAAYAFALPSSAFRHKTNFLNLLKSRDLGHVDDVAHFNILLADLKRGILADAEISQRMSRDIMQRTPERKRASNPKVDSERITLSPFLRCFAARVLVSSCHFLKSVCRVIGEQNMKMWVDRERAIQEILLAFGRSPSRLINYPGVVETVWRPWCRAEARFDGVASLVSLPFR